MDMKAYVESIERDNWNHELLNYSHLILDELLNAAASKDVMEKMFAIQNLLIHRVLFNG